MIFNKEESPRCQFYAIVLSFFWVDSVKTHQTAHVKAAADPIFNISICSDDLDCLDHAAAISNGLTGLPRGYRLDARISVAV